MYQLPQLKLENNIFYLDNSRMENYVRCNRRGEYAIVRARIQNKFNAALVCGEVFHLAMKFRYAYYPVDQPIPKEATYKMRLLVEQCYKDLVITDPEEYRTEAYVKGLITGYNNAHPTENFKLLDFEGSPLVEKSFAVKLGVIDGITFVWIGRVDLGIQVEDGRAFVQDFKTSSVGGDTYITPFYTSSQMQGYCLALSRVLNREVAGAQISAIFTRKPTKTGKGVEFKRYRVLYDPETLDSWQENMLHIASDFLHDYKRGFFPMKTEQCVTRYGNCPYVDVCRMAPSARLATLNGEAYKDDSWSPLRADKINLDELYARPLPSGWEAAVESAPPQAPEVNDPTTIADILNLLK